MKHAPLKSSNVASVAYDAGASTMDVTFTNGGTYRYHDVPAHKHVAMLAAESSHGKYLHEHIKPHHKATKVG